MSRFAIKYRALLVLPLSAGLLLVGLAVGPSYLSSPVAAAGSAKPKTVHMRIAGMTCAACARGLEASFRKMAGVEKVDVDYKAGQAVITFDPTKQTADSLSKFVAECGYKVKEIKVV